MSASTAHTTPRWWRQQQQRWRRKGTRVTCVGQNQGENGPSRSSSGGVGPSLDWTSFATRVEGHWVGTLAEFRGDTGEPIALAPLYVPEAYRAWGKELYDWPIHTVTRTDKETEGKVKGQGVDHTLRQLIPADTCECFDIEVKETDTMMLKTDFENEGEAKTILEDGSYSAGTRRLLKDGNHFVLETCLYCNNENENENENEKRIRIRQHVSYSPYQERFVMQKVELLEEVRCAVQEAEGQMWKADPLEKVVLDSATNIAERERLDVLLARKGDWDPFVGAEYYLELDESPQGGSFRLKPTKRESIVPLEPVAGNGSVGLPLGCWVRVDSIPGIVIFEAGFHRMEGKQTRKFLQRQYDDETGFLRKLIIGEQDIKCKPGDGGDF